VALRDDKRGMAIVTALAITETTSFGVVFYGFGTFLPSMEKDLGLSKSMITGAFSLALLISGVCGLAVGRYLDRHSPRMVMTIGSVLAVVGVVAWSHAHTIATLYLAWTLIGLAMSAILYEPAFVVIARRFSGSDRTRALTLVTLLAGFSSTIFVPLEEWLIRTQDWRPALRTMAVILLVVTVPLHGLVLRDAPPPEAQSADDPSILATTPSMTVAAAMRDRRFWFLLSAGFLIALTFSGMIAHQISMLEERGWVPRDAARAVGAIGLWQVGGRLVFAPLMRRVSSRSVTVVIYACQVVALVLLALSTAVGSVVVVVAATGIARGMYTLVRATLVGDLFGTANYGAISSRLALAATVAQAIGPLLGSSLHSGPGGYTTMLWVLAACAIAATALASQVERRPSQSLVTA
jgi:MFS family permease